MSCIWTPCVCHFTYLHKLKWSEVTISLQLFTPISNTYYTHMYKYISICIHISSGFKYQMEWLFMYELSIEYWVLSIEHWALSALTRRTCAACAKWLRVRYGWGNGQSIVVSVTFTFECTPERQPFRFLDVSHFSIGRDLQTLYRLTVQIVFECDAKNPIS